MILLFAILLEKGEICSSHKGFLSVRDPRGIVNVSSDQRHPSRTKRTTPLHDTSRTKQTAAFHGTSTRTKNDMTGGSQSYRPRSPDLSAYSQSPPQSTYTRPSSFQPFPQHRNSYDASPYFSPQIATPAQSYFPTQPQQNFEYQQPQYFNSQPGGFQGSSSQTFQYPPAQEQDSTMPRPVKTEDPDLSGRNTKRTMIPTHGGPSQGIEVKTKFPVARIKRIMQADEDVGKVAQATPTAVCK